MDLYRSITHLEDIMASIVWIDCPARFEREGTASVTHQSWDHGAIPADAAEWFEEIAEQMPGILTGLTDDVLDREAVAMAVQTYGEPRVYGASPDLRAHLVGEGPWTLLEARTAAYALGD